MRSKFLVALLLTCGAAQSAEWVSLGKATDGKSEPFVDSSSIRITDGIRRAWMKLVMAPQSAKGGVMNGAQKWVRNYTSREAFNCSEETHSTEAIVIYFEDGTNESEPAETMPYRWEPVAPDTSLANALQFLCAWKPK